MTQHTQDGRASPVDYRRPPVRASGRGVLWIDFLIVWAVLLLPVYPATALYWGGRRGSERTHQCLAFVLWDEVAPISDVVYSRPAAFGLLYPPVLCAAIAANHLTARRRRAGGAKAD